MTQPGSADFDARLEQLFQQASDLIPGDRPQFLDAECGGDPVLRDTVERLLRASEVAEASQVWDSALANEACLVAIEEIALDPAGEKDALGCARNDDRDGNQFSGC